MRYLTPTGDSSVAVCNAFCSGLFRNSRGDQVGVEFARPLYDMKDVLQLELHAILFGMEQFKDQRIEKQAIKSLCWSVIASTLSGSQMESFGMKKRNQTWGIVQENFVC